MDEYQDDYDYINNENHDKFQHENKKESRTNKIPHKNIHKLYKVISAFRKGRKTVEEPNVFRYLTEEKFTSWIVDNNPRFKVCK